MNPNRDRERQVGRPNSFYPRSLFSSEFFPSWEDFADTMNQWLGRDTGVTVSEDGQNVIVEAHAPGLKPEDFDISLDRNTLRIRGERKEEEKDKNKRYYKKAQHSFYYQVELPTPVQENTEEADYQDGILKITFAKSQKDNSKRIQVKKTQGRNPIQQQTQQTSKQRNR